ncbi:hypothetical protein ACFS7Z_13740 [Pontibacter toksunensis]|uniref:Uncharacterized protein n=1 Tax=Pontibacter toksunensis TaxID=1332631 RepID=A0ABW6BYH1_9BACT
MNSTNYLPRKKALTKSNTYKPVRKPKQNTYRKPQTSGKGGDSKVMKYLVIAAVGGAAFAILKDAGASPRNDDAAPSSASAVTPAPTQTVVTRPTPAPTKQPTVYKPAPTTTSAGNYVFVDSWNGEGIYAETSPIYSSMTGNGRKFITMLSNKCFVGLWTGKKANKMLEIYTKTSSGSQYNFWIAADQVKILSKAGYDQAMYSGAGKGKTSAELAAIINYFKK